MFDNTLKYAGFLKHIPLLPQLFEGMIKIHTLITNKKVIDYTDDIEQVVLSWEGTSVRNHKFGGLQFDVNSKEMGHIHGNGLLDVLFSREIKNKLMQEGRVQDHHVFKNSGWISFLILNEEEKKYAIRILRESYLLKLHR